MKKIQLKRILIGVVITSFFGLSIIIGVENNNNLSSLLVSKHAWSFKKLWRGYDLASVQRGYMVYRNECASCHSIQFMQYADLQQMGLTLDQINKLAATDQILDGKNALGMDHYRAATVKDFFPRPYPNEAAAKLANFNKNPVDFSRYAQIVTGGEDHIMAILMGYRQPPKNFRTPQAGYYYNLYAVDQQIAMKPPLTNNAVKYFDHSSTSVEQQARDVTTFLSWTSDPHLIQRHRIGIMAGLYTLFVLVLVFLKNRKVWSNVK
ncbi:Cytochrome b/c1 [Commensalibacter sp. Nvir]|uniref:cytochrome c1 n=1 Tax=Commensalibacter sp. Nvir TaxID=3069817 RepID=UPI002D63427D|nr:Cytochrome b/c1 [Commensalibacter sp. Nvir]